MVHKVYGYKEDGTPADCYEQVRRFSKTLEGDHHSQFFCWGVYGLNKAGHEIWIADYAFQNDANGLVYCLKNNLGSAVESILL